MEKAHGGARADRCAARGALDVDLREGCRVPESGHGHRDGWGVRRVRLARAAVTRARSPRRATWPFSDASARSRAPVFYGLAREREAWFGGHSPRVTLRRARKHVQPEDDALRRYVESCESTMARFPRPSARDAFPSRAPSHTSRRPLSHLHTFSQADSTSRSPRRCCTPRSCFRRPQGRQHPPRPTDTEEQGIRFRHLHGEVRPATRPMGTLSTIAPARSSASTAGSISPLRSFQPMFHRREDAAEAMNNMHNGELYGRVIRCNYAQPQRIKDGSAQPVWADADRTRLSVRRMRPRSGRRTRRRHGGVGGAGRLSDTAGTSGI